MHVVFTKQVKGKYAVIHHVRIISAAKAHHQSREVWIVTNY